MNAPAPFATAVPSSCKHAWLGGDGLPPQWRYWPSIQCIDTAGFHTLVRAAGLPEAELRHMGFKAHELRGDTGTYAHVERAVELLGRIAWDAVVGHHHGIPWRDTPGQRARARALGLDVIRAWFR